MDISARNQIKGLFPSIQSGKAMTFVTLQAHGMHLASAITNDGAQELNLKQNDAVTAIVKATEVILAKGAIGPLSARNRLSGRVSSVQHGEAMGLVKVVVGQETVEAAITTQAIKEMGLKEGDQVTAIIKATEVILAK
jgi:molybdate transport system regulatory protein